jgi:hypothetical protein
MRIWPCGGTCSTGTGTYLRTVSGVEASALPALPETANPPRAKPESFNISRLDNPLEVFMIYSPLFLLFCFDDVNCEFLLKEIHS